MQDVKLLVAMIVGTILAVLALFPMPSGYYDFLRFYLFILCIWGVIRSASTFGRPSYALVVGAVLYNPFIKIYLMKKPVWFLVDIILLVVIFGLATSSTNAQGMPSFKIDAEATDKLLKVTKTFFKTVFSLIFAGVVIWAATEYFYLAPERQVAKAEQQALNQKIRQETLERDNCIRLLDNKQIAYWQRSNNRNQREQWQQREKCLQKVHNGELDYELKGFAD